jgi:hypothetical protein
MTPSTNPIRRSNLRLTAAAVLAACFCAAGTVHATALTGSGPNLLGPAPTSLATIPIANPVVTGPNTGPWSGTWVGSSPTAAPAWNSGGFSATGPYSSGGGPFGTTIMSFAGMTGGVLPAGTYCYLGDLDDGSGPESFIVQAFDSAHIPLSSAWLDSAASIYGSGAGVGGLPAVTDTASWSYNAVTATYRFDGSGVPGNPAVALLLPTNQGVAELDIIRDTNNASFALQAPTAVPEPTTLGLLLVGAGLLTRRRRANSAR